MDGNVSTTGRPSDPARRRTLCATRMAVAGSANEVRDRSCRPTSVQMIQSSNATA